MEVPAVVAVGGADGPDTIDERGTNPGDAERNGLGRRGSLISRCLAVGRRGLRRRCQSRGWSRLRRTCGRARRCRVVDRGRWLRCRTLGGPRVPLWGFRFGAFPPGGSSGDGRRRRARGAGRRCARSGESGRPAPPGRCDPVADARPRSDGAENPRDQSEPPPRGDCLTVSAVPGLGLKGGPGVRPTRTPAVGGSRLTCRRPASGGAVNLASSYGWSPPSTLPILLRCTGP